MQPLVVVILTLNEEPNLAAALESVSGRVPVLVLDSVSTDATQQIAKDGGAELHVRAFDDYASQRNHALDLVRDRFEWVLMLDADERMEPELWDEVERAIERDDIDGVYIGMLFEVLGRDLRHGPFRIASNLRLMKTDKARFNRGAHERVDDSQMRVMRLRHKIRHADAKPLADWFRKHVRYAQWEADHYVETAGKRSLDGFGLRTKAARMIGVRWAYDQLPLFVRPWLYFGRTVAVNGAWRDGAAGMMYAGMQSLWFPMMIDLFILEKKRRKTLEGR